MRFFREPIHYSIYVALLIISLFMGVVTTITYGADMTPREMPVYLIIAGLFTQSLEGLLPRKQRVFAAIMRGISIVCMISFAAIQLYMIGAS